MKIREIKADFIRCDYRNIFNITQYNKNIPIKINLYEDGIPFTIPSGAIVKVEASVRSSKENVAVIISNVTIKDNYIIIKNPREMCLCNGDGALEVRIEKDDYIYITSQIKFKVIEAVISEDTTSSILMTTAKEELDETINNAESIKSQFTSTANPSYNIKVTDWTSTTIDGMSVYTYTLTHNLNTTNIIVSSYTSDNTNIDLPFKIINNNSIKFTSFEKEAFKVIVSANYQAVAGTLASGIATEVQDARGSYGTLDSRLDNIDTAITTKTETLDNKITTTKTELEQLISTSILEHDKNVTYAVGKPYVSFTDSRNPSEILGFGTWELTAQGKTLIGVNPNDNDFKTAGKTGGSKTQTLSVAQLPQNVYIDADTKDGTRNKWVKEEQGSNWCNRVNWATNNTQQESIQILPPYITVYIWKRIK